MIAVRPWLIGAVGAVVLLAAVLLVGVAAGAASAPAPVVTGQVVDASGAPVAQQAVVIEGPEGTATSVTNFEGRFIFYNLDSGDYQVSVPEADATKAVVVPDDPWYSKWFGQSSQTTPAIVDFKLDEFKGVQPDQPETPSPK